MRRQGDGEHDNAAARAITGNSVNGWDFWEAKQPGEESFTSLKALQALARL